MQQREFTISRPVTDTAPKRKSLIKEYIRRWYVFLLVIFMCLPAYVCEVLLYNTFVLKGISPFLSGVMAIFIGGFVSSIPLLIVNIKLIVKRRKYYAIAVQIAVMEIIGMTIFVLSQLR